MHLQSQVSLKVAGIQTTCWWEQSMPCPLSGEAWPGNFMHCTANVHCASSRHEDLGEVQHTALVTALSLPKNVPLAAAVNCH